jgi:hypothetical protein
MRWHVHGTDAVTGQAVELNVDAARAEEAIKAAIGRQIVVSYVTPGEVAKGPWRRPAAVASFMAVVGVALGLGAQNWSLRGTLRQAAAEQKLMSSSVAQAEHLAADIRTHGNLADEARAQVAKLEGELAAARKNASTTEARLSVTQRENSSLEKAAARVPVLEKQVAAAQAELTGAHQQLAEGRRTEEQLRGELALEGRRLEQLEKSIKEAGSTDAAQTAELEAARRKLAAENESLKKELLMLAAQPKPVTPASVAEVAPVAVGRWALGVGYDTARSFVALHADPATVASTPMAEGLVTSTGALPANAVTMKFVHDRAQERVYSATLTVSLAADAPREKLAENRLIIGAFLAAFAPGLKDADAVVAGATGQLTVADETRRLVYLAQDSKLTIWNSKGVYTFRVESVRGELE